LEPVLIIYSFFVVKKAVFFGFTAFSTAFLVKKAEFFAFTAFSTALQISCIIYEKSCIFT